MSESDNGNVQVSLYIYADPLALNQVVAKLKPITFEIKRRGELLLNRKGQPVAYIKSDCCIVRRPSIEDRDSAVLSSEIDAVLTPQVICGIDDLRDLISSLYVEIVISIYPVRGLAHPVRSICQQSLQRLATVDNLCIYVIGD